MARRAGSVAGCDFSGIVEEIGSNVPPGLRSIGERVAGLVLGGQAIPFNLTKTIILRSRTFTHNRYPPQRPGRICRIPRHACGLCRSRPGHLVFRGRGPIGHRAAHGAQGALRNTRTSRALLERESKPKSESDSDDDDPRLGRRELRRAVRGAAREALGPVRHRHGVRAEL